ncbi:MAG: hypothetical protein ACYSUU_07655 [Planctomycetota bacterium]|jgi:hypothetical protein
MLASILLGSGCDRGEMPAVEPEDGGVGVLGEPVSLDDDPVVAGFRAEAADYLEMRAALGDLDRRMAAGDATPEEVEAWRAMQEKCDGERLRLNTILYADSVDPERRRAMFWILQSAN